MTYIHLNKCTLKSFLEFNFIYLDKKEIYTFLQKAT
jgi:hypothetical protein